MNRLLDIGFEKVLGGLKRNGRYGQNGLGGHSRTFMDGH